MKRIAALAGMALIAGLAVKPALSQGWAFECIDPANTTPYSTDWGVLRVGNSLMNAVMGVSGTVTYGGQNGPCYGPTARTLDAAGRFSFFVGGTGSVQSDFDNFLALTVGAPADAAGDYTYARILKTNNSGAGSALFGDSGLNSAFIGASNRYISATWSDADVQVQLQVRVIGDAVRMGWTLTNLSADVQPLGLMWGSYVGMRTTGQTDSQTGANQANSGLGTLSGNPRNVDGYIGFTVPNTTRPVRNWRRYDSNNPLFPSTVEFNFGQTEAYGTKVDNIPGPQFQDATSADLFLIGNHRGPVGSLSFGNNFRTTVPGDLTGTAEEADILLNETVYLQRFPVQNVASGASREIAHYLRSTWSVADYRDPYMIVLDAPRILGVQANGLNGVTPNPFTVRAYIDNQYAKLDSEVALNNVLFNIELPAGFSLVPGESSSKIVPTVAPNQIRFVDWQVQSDGDTSGRRDIKVTVSPTPGPTRTLTASVLVSSTPRMNLQAGPNMVGFPYQFTDTSLNTILGLQAGVDYLAFKWDPELESYTQVSTPQRGFGYWIIPQTNLGLVTLANATTPTDTGSGGLLTTLKRGWNMIANPYNYPIRIGDLLGISEDNPARPFNWIEMVNNGFVSSALAFYDPATGTYRYTQNANDVLAPQRGYWIFVTTFNPLRISWPPVFTSGLPNSGRSPIRTDEFQQTDKQWRLQLVARDRNSMDSENFVGLATDRATANRLDLPKPPLGPTVEGQPAPVQLAIVDQFAGQDTRMASAFSETIANREMRIQVRAAAGDVTLTWPNLPSIPRNVRAKLTDVATGTVRDLRSQAGYTFTMQEAGTREFNLSFEVGGASRPTIGNVLVTRPSRDVNGPVTITYALSSDALVTVRILSGTGREVFTVSRGRSESSGENSVTWMLRDNANRAVAPGVYRAEILAESPNGERVRKIVPINVTR